MYLAFSMLQKLGYGTGSAMNHCESETLEHTACSLSHGQGCGSGPFLAGFGSGKSEFKISDPDNAGMKFFSYQSDFFRYVFNVDFLPEKMEKFSLKFLKANFYKIFDGTVPVPTVPTQYVPRKVHRFPGT